jgi:hypothetical protein
MEERVNEDEWDARYGDRLRRIEQTVFFGNGTRSLTSRADRAEQEIKAVKESVRSVREDVSAINKNIRWVVLLVLAAVIGEVLKLIFVKGL